MSKIKLAIFSGLLLLLPTVVLHAAYNDVSLNTSVIVQLGSDSYTLSGTGATIQSVTVGTTSFTVVIAPGSTFDVTIGSARSFGITGVDGTRVSASASCKSNLSTLSMNYPAGSGSAATVVITPASGTCGTGESTGGASASTVSTGGGGGGISSVAPNAIVTPIKIAVVTPVTTNAPSVTGSSLSNLANTTPVIVITKAFSVGQSSAEIKTIQLILNSDPETKISSSGAGSPGKETMTLGGLTVKAIKKFQEKWKIAKKGDTGYGVLGPKTRAKLNEVGKMLNGPTVPVAPVVITPSSQTTQATVSSLLEQIKLLQAALNKLKTQ